MDRDLESIQQVRLLIEKAAEAQKILARFGQEEIDAVVAAMADAARRSAEPLARLAVEETTYGVVADKVEKNLFSSRDVFSAIKNMKTVGVIAEDRENGVVEIAEPVGVVAAIIPCTNPTSTAIFKGLISLKARNAVVMSPHPSAVHCIAESVNVMREAAVQAGAPPGSLGCVTLVSNEATQELMRHRSTAVILATGGAGMVRSAYSSGKPALGVGPGNVPAYIHSSANIQKAVADILTGKCFDNGTICSSEQHMVVDRAIADQVRAEAERQGGFFLTADQARAVARLLILPNFRVNPVMVGQSAERIAKEAGIALPPGKRALIAPLDGIGRGHPLSAEKLSPVLSFFVVKDCHEGADVCRRLLEFGGMGHTMAIHAADDEIIRALALQLPAFRIVVNTPAPFGSIGYSTRLMPSMSLGCGTHGGNITTDNLSPRNLLNIKRLAYERKPVNPPATAIIPAAAKEPSRKSPVAAPSAAVAEQPPAPVSSGIPNPAEIAKLVERFLAAKEPASSTRESQGANAPGAQPKDPPAAASPPVRPVDFVSEADVRRAIEKGEKIAVGPKTIITPSARDLGEPHDIFFSAS